MSRLILPSNSFGAFVDYYLNSKEVVITFKSGKQYLYKGVSKTKINGLVNANNKGSYLSLHIISKYKGELLGVVPAAHIEQITEVNKPFFKTLLAR